LCRLGVGAGITSKATRGHSRAGLGHAHCPARATGAWLTDGSPPEPQPAPAQDGHGHTVPLCCGEAIIASHFTSFAAVAAPADASTAARCCCCCGGHCRFLLRGRCGCFVLLSRPMHHFDSSHFLKGWLLASIELPFYAKFDYGGFAVLLCCVVAVAVLRGCRLRQPGLLCCCAVAFAAVVAAPPSACCCCGCWAVCPTLRHACVEIVG